MNSDFNHNLKSDQVFSKEETPDINLEKLAKTKKIKFVKVTKKELGDAGGPCQYG